MFAKVVAFIGETKNEAGAVVPKRNLDVSLLHTFIHERCDIDYLGIFRDTDFDSSSVLSAEFDSPLMANTWRPVATALLRYLIQRPAQRHGKISHSI